MTVSGREKRVPKKKIVLGIVLSILVILIAIGGTLILREHMEERELEKLQNEKLQELINRRGEYDEQSIILADTSQGIAKNLAEKTGATLRITKDGSFATLTLPEGVTILDIYGSEKYLEDLPRMSADFQVKSAELIEEESERQTMPSKVTPSDIYYNRQTYLDYLNLDTVWNQTKGSDITVAVIDTGIDTDHPEFAGRISEYSYNATEDKIVKDYILDGGSYDWSLIEDEQGHGTSVTGVIAAAMNNSEGIVGIAPDVNIIVIKAECDANGTFARTSDLVFGLYYAIERDVNVVNMSFGTQAPTNPFAEAAQLAYDSDIICVAAAGNEATTALTYPAADEHVIGVGALDAESWELAPYSNYGDNLDMVAPGSVYTTKMGGGYGTTQGTSLASPITAGGIALFLSQNKYMTFDDVTEILYASCYDLGALGEDWDYGCGALDLSAFILEERGTITYDMLTDELENEEGVFIRNHTLQRLPEPERLYAVFDGWYYDPQCTQEYTYYEDEFVSDVTLYAHWVNEEDGIPFTYVTLPDDTIEIRSYTGHRRYITIPEKIEGKIVSSIGDFAFSGENRIREIKLPSGLNNIGRYAFENCSNLTEISIPAGVTQIGEKAFYNNVRLYTLVFESESRLATVGDFAFAYCSSLRKFELPASVTSVNGTAFVGNINLASIDVQAANTSFVSDGGVLFNNTKSTLVAYPAGITGNYTVPNSVRSVGDYAFAYARCKEVGLGNVQKLGNSAFVNASLEEVVIPDSITSMGDCAFKNNIYLSRVTFGSGLKTISQSAFADCIMLESVEIPANIQIISRFAFWGNSSLQSVTFAQNSELKIIGFGAFAYSALETIEFPKSLNTIDGAAFALNMKLSAVTFEEGSNLQQIGAGAFENSASLKTIDLPDNLSFIGDYAFKESGLTTVTLPASLTHLGAGVFASCHDLTSIEVDESNVTYNSIDGVVYTEDGKTVVAYPAGNTASSYNVLIGTTKVGDAAFYGSYNLNSIILPNGVETIGANGFTDCKNVTNYSLPESLTYIEEYAFACNSRLPTISIPDNVIQIARFAFFRDWSLQSVNFNKTSKLPRVSYAAFAYCGLRSFTMPANVSTMAQGSFMGCSNLTSFTFAENSKLTSISAYMFDGCNNLRTITFKSGSALTSIQAHGLEGMRKLTSIDFGNAKITNIDNFAFRFCESLTEFNVPEGVTYVGRYAFYYCTGLKTVRIPASVEYIGEFAFIGAENVNVYFAAETLPLYLAEDWDHGIRGYYLGVTEIVTDGDWQYAKLTSGDIAIIAYTGTETTVDMTTLDFGGDIVNIGGSAFAYSTVENVILPETLVTIQANAFYHSNLKSIIIPASVEFIGKQAFADTPITAVTFADGAKVKVIEQSAFEETELLGSAVLPASLERMGRAVFKNSGITSVIFADGIKITEISEEAFAYTKITSVSIPASVTVIGDGAFRGTSELASVSFGTTEELMVRSNAFYQSGLETLTIPANMTYIGEYAFVGLSKLTAFAVDSNNPYYTAVDGLLVTKDGRKLVAVPAGRTGSLTVPVSIEEIGFGAFEDSALSEILFDPNANILSLGYRAFFSADNITTITVPASVVSIDYYAFAECKSLETVIFAEGSQLSGIYEGAFYGDNKLTNIKLPSSVIEISDFAFYGCMSLTELPVEDTEELKGIYSYAFAYTGMTELVLPDNLIDIGDYAFKGIKITSLTIPDANKKQLIIGIGAFEDCNQLTEITVPFIGASFEDEEITWFGYIFGAGGYEANPTYVPESLKKVTITDGITFVGYGGFNMLSLIEEINVPHSVCELYDYSFRGTGAKYELTNTISVVNASNALRWYDFNGSVSPYFGWGITGELNLADGLKEIDYYAFGSTSLKKITIPKTVTYIDGEGGSFGHCFDLETIVVADENPNYFSFDGILYDKLLNTIVHVPDKIQGNITIPEGISEIKSHSFALRSRIKSVTLPNSVECIGEGAFNRCTGITSITIPSRTTSIERNAFSGCINLYVIYNNSDMILTLGEDSNGCIASYADLIIENDGTKIYRDEISGFEYIDTADGFRFVRKNSEYILIAYLGDSDEVTLPLNIYDNPYTIYRMQGVKNVIVPEGIEKINEFAFKGSGSLKRITLPNSVRSIESEAFADCNSLAEIVLPNKLNFIGTQAFRGCYDLTSIVIPDSVAEIGGGAFSESGLQNIKLPQNLEIIEHGMFAWCGQLLEIQLPESVTYIGGEAFRYCGSLSKINIPSNVTTIEAGAFEYCTSLKEFNISDHNLSYFEKDKIIYNADQTEIIFVLPSASGHIVLPDSLKVIPAAAFSDLFNITGVTIPEGVTKIGDRAFYGCRGISKLNIPKSVTSIGHGAFDGSGISAVYYKGDLLGWINMSHGGNSALYDLYIKNVLITDVIIPKDVTKIGDCTFAATSIKSIMIPNGVTYIGAGAFSNCKELEKISLPSSVIYIGMSSVSNCYNLRSISVDENNESYFSLDGILYDKITGEIVIVPKGISGRVTLSEQITCIKDYEFSGCENLTDVVIPNSLTKIGDRAFSYSGITSVTIPSSITEIGEDAFAFCEHLHVVHNNSDLSLEFGSDKYGSIAYSAKIIVEKDGTKRYLDEESDFEYIDTMDGFRFAKENGEYKLIAYLGEADTVTFPLDLNGYSYYIFKMTGVKNVIIPEGITSIGDEAFLNCRTLNSIKIANSVTYIGYSAFEGCTNLRSVLINDNVTTIGGYAFRFCTTLDNIIILSDYCNIGYRAFNNTAYYDNLDNWIDGDLYINNHLIKVSEEKEFWKLGEDVKISADAFENCYNLKKVVIKGDWIALYDCRNIETLILTELPTERIYYYFGSFPSDIPITLKNIVLTEDVIMHSDAFYGITGVTIYVEASEKDVKWDENFPGWNNGNTVIYGDKWITADFYDADGNLVSSEIFTTSQVIRQPYVEKQGDAQYSYVFEGWDINGDGVVDNIPATSTTDISATAVFKQIVNTYTVTFYDKDGVTVLYQFVLPYGSTVTLPTEPTKTGYTFLGWTRYTERMTVTGDIDIYSSWKHDGEGHVYAAPVWVAPTCTEQGYNKHVCTVCGEWYGTDYVAANGHSYTKSTVPPTCTEQGYDLWSCSCGDSYK